MCRRLIVAWCILSILCDRIAAQNKVSHIVEGRSGIVHMFEWKFDDIANDCQFLGEAGYGGVQVSPIAESRLNDKYSWLLRYEPVSYKISSRSGSVEDFKDMIKKCMEHKIRIYVDVVLNHMAGGEGEIMGTANSAADPLTLHYPAVPYQAEDFNEFCDIKNYSNAFEVRNCRLVGLPDLNQAKENVRDKIVAFMNELIDFGVAGFRIDSVS